MKSDQRCGEGGPGLWFTEFHWLTAALVSSINRWLWGTKAQLADGFRGNSGQPCMWQPSLVSHFLAAPSDIEPTHCEGDWKTQPDCGFSIKKKRRKKETNLWAASWSLASTVYFSTVRQCDKEIHHDQWGGMEFSFSFFFLKCCFAVHSRCTERTHEGSSSHMCWGSFH